MKFDFKKLKKDIEDNSRYLTLDCECCSDEFIEVSALFSILKQNGVKK